MSIKSGRDVRSTSNGDLRFPPHEAPENRIYPVDPEVTRRFMARMAGKTEDTATEPVAVEEVHIAAAGPSKYTPGRVSNQITDDVMDGWYTALKSGKTTAEAIEAGPVQCSWPTARAYLLKYGYDLSCVSQRKGANTSAFKKGKRQKPTSQFATTQPSQVITKMPPSRTPATNQLDVLEGIVNMLRAGDLQAGEITIRVEITIGGAA